jgi:nitroreductase
MSPRLALDTAAQNLLFREARTANTFTDEPVTDEQIRAIYDLIKYAPTSMNQQPLRVVLVRSREARERLPRRGPSCAGRRQHRQAGGERLARPQPTAGV